MMVVNKGIIAFFALLVSWPIDVLKVPLDGMSTPRYVYFGTTSSFCPLIENVSFFRSLPDWLKTMTWLFLVLMLSSLISANLLKQSSLPCSASFDDAKMINVCVP